jgi:serine phosphatase RsbU (regulator of sigma subunit)
MEIRGGSQAVETSTSTPGLDIWVYSRPYEGAANGGDVHYVSLCGGGIVTKLIVADVSGHGAAVADMARDLRTLMRRFINSKSQDRLVRELNRQFTKLADMRRFATAVVATYLATTRRLTICNAGHPRPLVCQASSGAWSLLMNHDDGRRDAPANIPLGIDGTARYSQLALDLGEGDLVLFYTDALIEATNSAGRQLGEQGLLDIVRNANRTDPAAIARTLPAAIETHRGGKAADDDLTFLLLRCNAGQPARLSLRQKVDVYAKFFGLKPV